MHRLPSLVGQQCLGNTRAGKEAVAAIPASPVPSGSTLEVKLCCPSLHWWGQWWGKVSCSACSPLTAATPHPTCTSHGCTRDDVGWQRQRVGACQIPPSPTAAAPTSTRLGGIALLPNLLPARAGNAGITAITSRPAPCIAQVPLSQKAGQLMHKIRCLVGLLRWGQLRPASSRGRSRHPTAPPPASLHGWPVGAAAAA